MMTKPQGWESPFFFPHSDRHRERLGLRGDLQNTGIGMGGELLVTTEMSWDLCRFSLLTDPLSLPISWCSVSHSSDGLLSATNWGQTRSFGVLSWLLPSAVVVFPCAWHWPGCSFSCRTVGFVLLGVVHLSLSRQYDYEVICMTCKLCQILEIAVFEKEGLPFVLINHN